MFYFAIYALPSTTNYKADVAVVGGAWQGIVYVCVEEFTMKINDKHLIAFVSGSAAVDKQGFLNKRGELNKAFQRRWFVLKGNLLFYFERRTDPEPIGVIVIDGCSVELTENSDKYAFELAFSGSGTRTYVLAADSQVTG